MVFWVVSGGILVVAMGWALWVDRRRRGRTGTHGAELEHQRNLGKGYAQGQSTHDNKGGLHSG